MVLSFITLGGAHKEIIFNRISPSIFHFFFFFYFIKKLSAPQRACIVDRSNDKEILCVWPKCFPKFLFHNFWTQHWWLWWWNLDFTVYLTSKSTECIRVWVSLDLDNDTKIDANNLVFVVALKAHNFYINALHFLPKVVLA